MLPLSLKIIITRKRDSPCIEIRKSISNVEDIKKIIRATMRGEPLTIFPVFPDRIRSINSLIEKGIIYYDQEDGQYYFTL